MMSRKLSIHLIPPRAEGITREVLEDLTHSAGGEEGDKGEEGGEGENTKTEVATPSTQEAFIKYVDSVQPRDYTALEKMLVQVTNFMLDNPGTGTLYDFEDVPQDVQNDMRKELY